MRQRRWLVALSLWLSACHVPSDPSLNGDYRILRIAAFVVPPNVMAHAHFADGELTGGDGCNGFSNSYLAAFGHIRFDAGRETVMICANDRGRTEAAFDKAFSGVDRYRVDGDQMVLLAGDQPRLILLRAR